MSTDAILRLSARLPADYLSGGHRDHLISDFNDVASVGQDAANSATQSAASAAAAAQSYLLQLALGMAAYGVGIDSLDLVRAGSLGSAAYVDWPALVHAYPNVQDTTYQIRPDDFGKLLLATSGTRTWTLPAASDVGVGWFCRWRNRSGNNLTINRSGSDTFNAAATTVALATATSGMIVCTSSTTFEVY